MVGSNFGKLFKLTTWGESHGKALGCVIEGVPSNIKLNVKLGEKVKGGETIIGEI